MSTTRDSRRTDRQRTLQRKAARQVKFQSRVSK